MQFSSKKKIILRPEYLLFVFLRKKKLVSFSLQLFQFGTYLKRIPSADNDIVQVKSTTYNNIQRSIYECLWSDVLVVSISTFVSYMRNFFEARSLFQIGLCSVVFCGGGSQNNIFFVNLRKFTFGVGFDETSVYNIIMRNILLHL